MFWNRSLRLVLEVVDRRRSPRQLSRILAPSVLESVARLAISDNPHHRSGSAAVHRAHTRAVSAQAAEVCATYLRGRKCYAVAGRVERTDEAGWTITALHVV